ncbi:EAL domain-containing protein [Brumicola nitratireducens]|nr:EAL domain-containing protein [Glaciecola nitratireducens]
MNAKLMSGLDAINDTAMSPSSVGSVMDYLGYQLAKMNDVLGLSGSALCVSRAGHLLDKDSNNLYVIGAINAFLPILQNDAATALPKRLAKLVQHCFDSKTHYYSSKDNLMYLNYSGLESLIYFESATALEVSEQKIAETMASQISIGLENVNLYSKLKTTSFNDWLTKLPNRNEFINLISAMKTDLTVRKQLALVDLSHFSDINDGLGQDIGNSLLVAVSKRLVNSFSDGIQIGRITGDVFGIIGDASFVAPHIINDLFREPFSVSSHALLINVNIGFYEIQANVDAIYQLRCANVALNHAKKSISKNAAFYSPAMDDETRKRLDIIRNLQHDFECEKLEVWYQPQIDLLTEETVGVEALLRWRDSKGEFISPEVFVPLAEYSGLIVEIGKWVLAESVRRLKVLIAAGYSHIRMAVNVSVLQFRDQSFVNYVKYVIDLHGIPPKLLELEITESVVMDEPEIVIQALNQLKAFGVHIAIDDFGTGFSSMSYIQKLPLDRLKIDRSFVKDIDTNKDAFIAQAIVNLGKQLGLITIAEGVERKSQASQMLKLGTDEAQGYLFAKPMPFSDLKTYLLSHSYQKVAPDNT